MDLKYNNQAIATFEITSWEETAYEEPADGPKLSRAVVKKIFQGEIEGESSAELLMCQADNGSAGYVALERVVGRLGNRAGSFVVQHCATSGDPTATAHWSVVPGSGTGELRGLRGEAQYQHDEHKATFTLNYDIETQPQPAGQSAATQKI